MVEDGKKNCELMLVVSTPPEYVVVPVFDWCCSAVQMFVLPSARPTVRAVAPVYEPENVSEASVAVSAPSVPPKEMLEMVEAASCALPMVEEAMTRPVASVARSDIVEGEVRYVAPVLVNIVVLACVKKVVEAKTMVSLSHSGVVVL